MAQLEASLAALRAQAGRQQRLADIKALTAAGHFSEAARELLHLQSQLAGSPGARSLPPFLTTTAVTITPTTTTIATTTATTIADRRAWMCLP